MKKILFLTIMALILGGWGFGKDPLETVKSEKIKGSNLTWGQAAEEFKYCKEGTKKWELVKEREDNSKKSKGKMIEVSFTCEVNDESLELYNSALKRASNKGVSKTENRLREMIKSKQEIADANRPYFREHARCKECKTLKSLTDEQLDELAYIWEANFKATGDVQKIYAQNATLKALNEEDNLLSNAAFSKLAESVYEIKQLEKQIAELANEPRYQTKLASQMKYTLELKHSTNEQRIKFTNGGEKVSSSEGISYILGDRTERKSPPNKANYMIENKNPIYMISCASAGADMSFNLMYNCQW